MFVVRLGRPSLLGRARIVAKYENVLLGRWWWHKKVQRAAEDGWMDGWLGLAVLESV